MEPGLKIATAAVMSRKLLTPILLSASRIPELSSWNTPVVSPLASIAKVSGSERGSERTSSPGSLLLASSSAFCRTVTVLSPSTSSFRRPAESRLFISYWVVMVWTSSLTLHSGTKSWSSPGAMITPAAWTEVFLARSSRNSQCSKSFAILGSASALALTSGAFSTTSPMERSPSPALPSCLEAWETSRVRASTSSSGMPMTLPTSLIELLAFIRLNVTIWQTLRRPYIETM